MKKTIAFVLKTYNAFKDYIKKFRADKDDDIFDNPYLIL